MVLKVLRDLRSRSDESGFWYQGIQRQYNHRSPLVAEEVLKIILYIIKC